MGQTYFQSKDHIIKEVAIYWYGNSFILFSCSEMYGLVSAMTVI